MTTLTQSRIPVSSQRQDHPILKVTMPCRVSDEILEMMKSVKDEEDKQPGMMIDRYPDQIVDTEGNPVDPDTVMTQGKYKNKDMTLYQIYVDDKKYVRWILSHIDMESTTQMKKAKVFFAFVDSKKMRRMEKEQGPTKKKETAVPSRKDPQSKNQAKAKSVGTKKRSEEALIDKMEWEQVNHLIEESSEAESMP